MEKLTRLRTCQREGANDAARGNHYENDVNHSHK